MTKVHCQGEVSFDIREISDAAINAEFRRREALMHQIRDELASSIEEKEASDFTIDVLRAALFKKGVEADDWIPEVYRMVAEGRIADALHVMKSEFPELAPPSHERKVADLLSYGRA